MKRRQFLTTVLAAVTVAATTRLAAAINERSITPLEANGGMYRELLEALSFRFEYAARNELPDAITRQAVVSELTAVMQNWKSGLADASSTNFYVKCDTDNNSPKLIDAGRMHADVFVARQDETAVMTLEMYFGGLTGTLSVVHPARSPGQVYLARQDLAARLASWKELM